jgi:predicted amidophosphoribosyltransferase
MECKKCHTVLTAGTSFCPKCGKKVPPPPKEKKPVDLNAKLGFSAAEAAAAVGVSVWFMYEEIKQGSISYCQLHGRKVISRWALEDYLRKNEVPAKEAGAY